MVTWEVSKSILNDLVTFRVISIDAKTCSYDSIGNLGETEYLYIETQNTSTVRLISLLKTKYLFIETEYLYNETEYLFFETEYLFFENEYLFFETKYLYIETENLYTETEDL